MSQTQISARTRASVQYAEQAEKLSLETSEQSTSEPNGGLAIEAKFITPLDPVVETADGGRLPPIPVPEAHRLNLLRDRARGHLSKDNLGNCDESDGEREHATPEDIKEGTDPRLELALPPSRTHPLFPPLPLYGPRSMLRDLQCLTFRATSFFLSTGFLAVIVLGSVFTSIPTAFKVGWRLVTLRDPDGHRPFNIEEKRRKAERKAEEKKWIEKRKGKSTSAEKTSNSLPAEYEPSEGGPDKLICDVRYYARRVGLDMEEFKVQTEDGFIITLWHVYNPIEYKPVPRSERNFSSPEVFSNDVNDMHDSVRKQYEDGKRRYPVLLIHGLLQSAGAYCTNDDDSLAFLLCKSGYDVWLGNNRCGFNPEHTLLSYNDPRMWSWNIRQMGVLDLPALISRVLEETGFEKLGLVCHSQGTTETFVALAKAQRPDLGEKISVFCALAPAVYAGPLIGKMYFKFMKVISPDMFRIFFGIHSFIPLMMTMHRVLPGKLYGAMGYRVFSFLFNWTDTRWDRGLRDRLFQFSPVYVSAESMRWWLGRDCFAKHKCVLATREEGRLEEVEDEEEEERRENEESHHKYRGRTAWYDEQVPPMALWIAGNDKLVDGRRLLRRFQRGREPHVRIVHSKVIDDYEHLDVLWAIDAVDQVGKEVRQVLYNTMPVDARKICRNIQGAEEKEENSDASSDKETKV